MADLARAKELAAQAVPLDGCRVTPTDRYDGNARLFRITANNGSWSGLEGDRLMRDGGYAGIDVEVTAYCDGCGGSGKVRNKRRRALYATKRCPICKGRNSEVTIVPRTRVLG